MYVHGSDSLHNIYDATPPCPLCRTPQRPRTQLAAPLARQHVHPGAVQIPVVPA